MSVESDLIVALAGCSLATSPGNKDNWVEKSGAGGKGGQLPEYICKIARGVMRSGKSKSSAIAIAVSRVKAWAAGGDEVNADTRAKAAKAVAQWEAMKAKAKSSNYVKATREDGETYLALSHVGGGWNLRAVEDAWYRLQSAQRKERLAEKRAQALADMPPSRYLDEYPREVYDEDDDYPYTYLREVWTNYVIVEYQFPDRAPDLAKVPYVARGVEVEFGEPVLVEAEWVERDDNLDEFEKSLLADVMGG